MAEERLLWDVLKELHDRRKSGGLYVGIVETSEDILRIYFEEGTIYHLRYGSAVGNDCIEILEYYTLYSATFFEGVRAPDKAAGDITPTGEIIARVGKFNKKSPDEVGIRAAVSLIQNGKCSLPGRGGLDMARIGILTCSNATQDLGCSSASCLADLRKRKGYFADYPAEQPLDLVGIINCPGCPTLTGPDKLLQRVRGLTEFRIDVIHFSNCVKALCPFKEKYERALNDAFPGIRTVIGTHQEHITTEEFRQRVKKLFCQPRKTMIDMILDKD